MRCLIQILVVVLVFEPAGTLVMILVIIFVVISLFPLGITKGAERGVSSNPAMEMPLLASLHQDATKTCYDNHHPGDTTLY